MDSFSGSSVKFPGSVPMETGFPEKVFINLTNHPFSKWGDDQKVASEKFGECIDIPFPFIDPYWSKEDVTALAKEYAVRIMEYAEKSVVTVHLMGEFTFCLVLYPILKKRNISCVVSCSERITEEKDGVKISRFRFCQFRQI